MARKNVFYHTLLSQINNCGQEGPPPNFPTQPIYQRLTVEFPLGFKLHKVIQMYTTHPNVLIQPILCHKYWAYFMKMSVPLPTISVTMKMYILLASFPHKLSVTQLRVKNMV